MKTSLIQNTSTLSRLGITVLTETFSLPTEGRTKRRAIIGSTDGTHARAPTVVSVGRREGALKTEGAFHLPYWVRLIKLVMMPSTNLALYYETGWLDKFATTCLGIHTLLTTNQPIPTM